MDSTRSRQRLTDLFAKFGANFGGRPSRFVLPVAPMAAMIAATLVALVILAMPIDSLETLVEESGIATLVTAAAPPLGPTARFAIAFVAALAVGAIVWFAAFLLIGARKLVIRPRRRRSGERIHEPKPVKRSRFSKRQRDDGVPVLRRADAHPDAPARRPVFATSDLGTPFLDVKAATEPEPIAPFADAAAMTPATFERDIPRDLDTPLASYIAPIDAPEPQPEVSVFEPAPAALPIMAEPPVPEPTADVAPAPIAPPRFAPHERIETFDLTPLVRPAPAPRPAPEPQPETSRPLAPATIHDLLARLEAGVQRRAEAVAPKPEPEPEPAEPSLEDTLAVLRQLASRVG